MKKLLLSLIFFSLLSSQAYALKFDKCYIVEGSEDWVAEFITDKFDSERYEERYFQLMKGGHIQSVYIRTESEVKRIDEERKKGEFATDDRTEKIIKTLWNITFANENYIEAEYQIDELSKKSKITLNLRDGTVVLHGFLDLVMTNKCSIIKSKDSSYLDYWWALILIIAVTFFIYTQSGNRLKKIRKNR